MSGPGCNCMECRVRVAICGADETMDVDINEVLGALGEVTAEMLAHVSTEAAKTFTVNLLIARKHWQNDPNVAIQHTEGNA